MCSSAATLDQSLRNLAFRPAAHSDPYASVEERRADAGPHRTAVNFFSHRRLITM